MATSLNKVVEQVAYKQVEDLIVYMEMLSDQIIQTSKVAKANQITFSTPAVSNGDMNKKLAESSAIVKKLQSDYSKLQNSYDNLIKKVDNYTTAKKNNTTAITNNSISQSQLLKNVKEEEVKTSSLTTYIQKLSVDRIRASRVVADYNAQIALGTKLTEEQSNELAQATVQFQKYDKAIKAGKASIGDAREYVGQYERANTGLSNSVAQITRELPAATFGFQTFALGISNNIPIAVDEIKKAVEINKELIAQGKPVTSIWSQLSSALFSFNSVMSVGLLLLALYGKEIGNFFKNLVSGTESLEVATKTLNEFQKAQSKGVENTKNELQIYKEYLTIASGVYGDKQKQKIAIDNLRNSYGGYLSALSDEQIAKLKGSKIDKEIQATLGYGEQYKTNLQQVQLVNQRIEAYKLELSARQNYVSEIKRLEKIRFDSSQTGSAVLQAQNDIVALKKLEEARKKAIEDETIRNSTSVQLQMGLNESLVIYDASLKKSQVLKEKSILLEYNDKDAKDENTKSIKLNTKAREDYLASEYELLHLRLTNLANANKEIMDDEASSYELRLQASEQYYNNIVDLANMEAKEELRVLEFATADKLRTTQNEFTNQKDQLDNYLSEGKISREKYNKAIKDAEETLQYDRNGVIQEATAKQNIIYENQAQSLVNANKELVGQLRKAWDEINFNKADLLIGNIELQNIQDLGNALSGIGDDLSIEEIQRKLQEVNRISKEASNDINRREAQVQLERAERSKARIELEIRENGLANNLSETQIQNQLFNNKALQDADAEIIASKKRVAEADNAKTQQEIDNLLKVKEEERRYNDAVYEGRLELYHSIADLGSQLFENSINRYDNEIEKSNEYYDSLIGNAEKGSEQEILLQEEKARKEEELQKRKVALQRKQAIFNKLLAIADIAINLQATIAKNNATLGSIVAVPINTLAIVSAAIQAATVLAVPLPQYKDGRGVGKDEFAIVGDGGVSEVIERGNGKIEMTPNKSTLTYLGAKDKVHSSLEDFQKSKLSLENASIMASFANQKMQLEMFDYYLGRELKGLPDRIEKSIEKGFRKSKNNVVVNNNINLPKRPTNFFN
jgi:hypothetical protein